MHEKIKQILIEDWNYPEEQVNGIIDKISRMEKSIYEAFLSWTNSKDMPTKPKFNGYTPKLLLETYPIKPPAAFMLLDWIHREPEEAINALNIEYGKIPIINFDD